jgi:anhydro-N-acetylmuramic acid kinase
MRSLTALLRKRRFLAVGLMSGTSADGIDASLVSIQAGKGPMRIRPLAFRTFPYPRGFREMLMTNSLDKTASVAAITRMNVLVGKLFADAAIRLIRHAGHDPSDVDLIGSHGQTIHHLPQSVRLFGLSVRGTMQIGDPDVIAKETGIITVGDFRAGDVALGGTGAPLMPAFDQLVYSSRSLNRGMLNIGGIANITVLPRAGSAGHVAAFDTGPGNMLIDALCRRLYAKPFDAGGTIAGSGRILTPLLTHLISHPYFKRRPPKSTGRETFGEGLAEEVLRRRRGAPARDLIATVSEFTLLSIYDAYMRHIRKHTRLDELVVSGGGAHNAYLMEGLKAYFGPVRVTGSDELGLSPDAKEAIAFAVFAVQTILGRPVSLPAVTGARRAAVLGKIALP